MKLERRHHPLAPGPVFRRRILTSFSLAGALLGGSLAIGIAGYHWLGGLAWLDALVNASMILGGMGPVDPITRPSGKWFAAAYALYSGIALLTCVGIIFAPAVHRLLHAFHVEERDAGGRD
ncbi:MAG: hypothetical protein ACRENJ_03140 [Candidatus Eiseniibacteriota bacterium]